MTLRKTIPYDELDRHHDQAYLALESAIQHDNETVYQSAKKLEEKIRMEKIRRWKNRQEPIQ